MDTVANVWPADNSGVSSHRPAARNRHAAPLLDARRRRLGLPRQRRLGGGLPRGGGTSARRAAGGAFACRAAANLNNASAAPQIAAGVRQRRGGGAAEASPLPLPLPRVVELGLRTHGIPRGATLVSMQQWRRLPRRQPEGAAASAMHQWRPPRRQGAPPPLPPGPPAISAAARLPMPCPSLPNTLRAPRRLRPCPEKINCNLCARMRLFLCRNALWKIYPINRSHYTVL